uniref:NADH-ubiquinone oxidoreductase chain 4 n=1 Tax=Cryptolestes ferrugineus TaxID=58000 RepID=A0A0U2NAI4_9CUCU|nr:NADH dehydrogenase subunit 4 [Cryptolestes ferrugineus]ALI86995.1 NADH dehydrogenase subunit 4 [Cryptolestes ferrugineus]
MMKFIFFLIFLIPLSFLNLFWLFQVLLFLISGLFLMMFSFNNQFINISYLFGLDLLSYCLVLLSFWVCALMVLASEKIYLKNSFYKLFMLVMIILLISLVLTFSSLNLFIFYLFFEISLIPTLMLIIGWGYQPERVEAGMYLLFYTLLVSLPMMMSIFYFYSNFYSLEFTLSILLNYEINNFLVFFVMIFIFLVKFPMFFVHLWLPKAHVEAPVSGSMILAGIMLKLGGYGLIRVIPLFMKLNISINWFFIVISMVGGFIVSLICIRQSDMKSLIAYSSVAHMGMVLGGLMTLNYWGMWGALVMMLAHGLCSSALFCLANISYERVHSRSVYLNKGLINVLPSLTLWWFLFSSCNMAAPPSMNLLGEILLMNSLVSYSMYMMIFLGLMSFFSAVYSLYLFAYTQHGSISLNLYSYSMGYLREYLLLMLHYLPLNMLFMKSELFVLWI